MGSADARTRRRLALCRAGRAGDEHAAAHVAAGRRHRGAAPRARQRSGGDRCRRARLSWSDHAFRPAQPSAKGATMKRDDSKATTAKQGFATRVIHAGQSPDPSTGAIMPPIYATSTYVQSSPGVHKGLDYGRSHNPTRWAFERCVADLENGAMACAFASGLAAISTVLELIDAHSHIVSGDDIYGGSFRLFDKVRRRSANLEVSYVDLADPEALQRTLRPETRLVW